MGWQEIIVAALILGAITYLGFWYRNRRRHIDRCAGCGLVQKLRNRPPQSVS